MGRAIKVDNDITELKDAIKQLKTAFSGIADELETLKTELKDSRATSTVRKNIDIHKETSTNKKKKTKKLVEEEAV
jgi:archaellum component FlaC